MNLNNFTKEELTIIEGFIKSSHNIKNIYEKLEQLDINNLKNSQEYIYLINKLKQEINIENNKYKNANLTTEQKTKIIELLASNPNSSKKDNIDTIINQQDNDLITRRVFNILVNQTVTNIDYTKNNIPTELLEFINAHNLSINDNKINKEINNYTKIQLAISNDINLVFLSILQDNLNLWKYSQYKNNLLKSFYSTLFINKNIEEQLINNNFNIDNNVYISSKLINDLLNSNSTIYNIISSILVEPQLDSHISNLLKIKDTEYNYPSINIYSILTECYIRSLLTFLTNERVQYLKKQFHYLIINPTYSKDNRNSQEIIINCFKNTKQDKSKKGIISLNLHK